MASLYNEVAKLELPFLLAGVAETIVTVDNFMGLAPVNFVNGIQYQYTAEATITTGNSGSFITPDGTFTPMTASYTSTTQNLTFVGASFTMPRALASDVTIATEVMKKAKAVGRKMGDSLINGRSTDANLNFTGLRYTVSGSSTQDIAAAAVGSGSFSLAKLDQALSVVNGRPNLIVTSNAGLRYFKNAIRSSGTTAQSLQIPNYGTPFIQYDGIPVVVSDWIGNEENGGTSMYCVYASEIDGVHLWSNAGQLVSVAGPVPVVNSLSDNYTVGGAYGFVIPSVLNVSRVFGILS